MEPNEGWEERVAALAAPGKPVGEAIERLKTEGFVSTDIAHPPNEFHFARNSKLGWWVSQTHLVSLFADHTGRIESHTAEVLLVGP